MPGDQIRSFISVDLEDKQILSKVESIVESLSTLGGDLKPVERENIHLTFKFLGNITPAKLAEVKSVLSQVKFEPFQLEIKGTGAFPNMKRMNVIWIGIGEGWTEAQLIFEQTERLLHEVGFSRETRPFSPHITVARVRSVRKTEEIAAFLGHLSDQRFGAIAADRLKLKQSVLFPSGPKYSTLFEVAAKR